MRRNGLLLLLGLVAVSRATAQDTAQVTVPVDREQRDSTSTAERLAALVRERVPTMPRLGSEALLPAGSRYVITRDSLDWSGAATVGDVLAGVPGAFLWRAGGISRPEPANFAGRGAASVEYVLDGIPYLALGPDSTGVDPALLPLGLLDRIEIERWPSTLRVRLYSRSNDRAAAESHIVLAAGPSSLAHYEAAFDRRFTSGFGGKFGMDYLKVPSPGSSTGAFLGTHLLGEASYVPTSRGGVAFQFLSSSIDRDAFSDGGPVGERVEGRRTDLRLHAFAAGRDDGMGLRADLVATRASWDSMGIDQSVARAGGVLTWRRPRTSAIASAYYGSRWTRLDAELAVGWSPAALVTLGLNGRYRTHVGGRSSAWAGARAGIDLPGGASLYGSARAGTIVAAPADLSSAEQDIREGEVGLLWRRRFIGFDARAARTAAFDPTPFQEISSIPQLDSTPEATWLSAQGYLRPIEWFTVTGSTAAPTGTAPSGAPARHWTAEGTIRSRFQRTFRSGVFDLKLSLGYEGWQQGILGFDELGAPVVLPEAHFLRSHFQVSIESFTVFWQSRNLLNEVDAHVPGFHIPRYSGFFGVRWGFRN